MDRPEDLIANIDRSKPDGHTEEGNPYWNVRCRIPLRLDCSVSRNKPDMDVRAEDDEDSPGSYVLTAIASSSSVDWYGTEMSLLALENMAQQFRDGVPILPSHGNCLETHEWDGVIGRSFAAEIKRADVAEPADASEQGFTLHVSSRVHAGDEDNLGRKLLRALRRGDPIGTSIGGWFVDVRVITDPDTDDVLRIIVEEVLLDHLAITRSPANPDSWIESVTGLRSKLSEHMAHRDRPESNELLRTAPVVIREVAETEKATGAIIVEGIAASTSGFSRECLEALAVQIRAGLPVMPSLSATEWNNEIGRTVEATVEQVGLEELDGFRLRIRANLDGVNSTVDDFVRRVKGGQLIGLAIDGAADEFMQAGDSRTILSANAVSVALTNRPADGVSSVTGVIDMRSVEPPETNTQEVPEMNEQEDIAILASLAGARGRNDIPDEERAAVYADLASRNENLPPLATLNTFAALCRLGKCTDLDKRTKEVLAELGASLRASNPEIFTLEDTGLSFPEKILSVIALDNDEETGEDTDTGVDVHRGTPSVDTESQDSDAQGAIDMDPKELAALVAETVRSAIEPVTARLDALETAPANTEPDPVDTRDAELAALRAQVAQRDGVIDNLLEKPRRRGMAVSAGDLCGLPADDLRTRAVENARAAGRHAVAGLFRSRPMIAERFSRDFESLTPAEQKQRSHSAEADLRATIDALVADGLVTPFKLAQNWSN